MGTFEKLVVWKRSKDLAVRICRALRGCRDYSLRNQIQRASVSVSSNIAEGMERNTKAEYRNFLGIAKGSAGEVRNQLWILWDLGHIAHDDAYSMIVECEEISRMLHGLIRSMQQGAFIFILIFIQPVFATTRVQS